MSKKGYKFSISENCDQHEDEKLDEHLPTCNLLSAFNAEAHKQDVIKVYLKIRPLTKDDPEFGQKYLVKDSSQQVTVTAPADSNSFRSAAHGASQSTHQFSFTKIFGEEVKQTDFFISAVLPAVEDFVLGMNCLIFTYGVTNSGKTYTTLGTPQDAGIIPRSLDVIINSLDGQIVKDLCVKPLMFCDVTTLSTLEIHHEKVLKETLLHQSEVSFSDTSVSSDASSTTFDASGKSVLEQLRLNMNDREKHTGRISLGAQSKMKFSLWVSFVEIYNEYVYDLLEPCSKKRVVRRISLALRDDKSGTPYLRGLREVCVNTADEAYKLLTLGRRNLQVAATKLNQCSSRSHCIFTIKVVRFADVSKPHIARVNMFSFCDLAGAERYTKTHGTGQRIKEAGNINTSLLTLGRCIEIMRKNQSLRQQSIVPFRDSKLTRLFQSFFCGKGKVTMVVNVNQLPAMFDETLHALKYSAIARKIVTQCEKTQVSLFKVPAPPVNRRTIEWEQPRCSSVRIPSVIVEEEEVNGDPQSLQASLNEKDCLINDLRKQIEGLKRNWLAKETAIRVEVTEEMSKQIVEIEKSYKDYIQEAEIDAELNEDQRIHMLVTSQNQAKKRKINDDKGLNTELQNLRVENAKLKADNVENLMKSQKKINELQERVTSLTFELAERQTQNDELKENSSTDINSKLKKILKAQTHAMEKQDQALREKDGRIEEEQKLREHTEMQLQAKIAELKSVNVSAEVKAEGHRIEIKSLNEELSDSQGIESSLPIEKCHFSEKGMHERLVTLEKQVEEREACSKKESMYRGKKLKKLLMELRNNEHLLVKQKEEHFIKCCEIETRYEGQLKTVMAAKDEIINQLKTNNYKLMLKLKEDTCSNCCSHSLQDKENDKRIAYENKMQERLIHISPAGGENSSSMSESILIGGLSNAHVVDLDESSNELSSSHCNIHEIYGKSIGSSKDVIMEVKHRKLRSRSVDGALRLDSSPFKHKRALRPRRKKRVNLMVK